MSSSVYEFRSVPAQVAIASPRHSTCSVISISESPSFAPADTESLPSSQDGLGCARGIRAAFVLEGGLALLLYGIWQLWHLAH